MDHAMTEEIVRRVLEQLAPPAEDGRPRLLLLSREHGTACHALLEDAALRERWRVDCALLREGCIQPEAYAAAVLFGFSCDRMAELAGGCCTGEDTRLARRLLLLGRKLYIPAEEVELYRYRETAPAAYYEMLQGQLALLTASGAVVCGLAELKQRLLGGAAEPEPAAKPPAAEEAAFVCGGRVLTERDVAEAARRAAGRIRIGARCIVTALAQELADERRIEIVRCESLREGGGL